MDVLNNILEGELGRGILVLNVILHHAICARENGCELSYRFQLLIHMNCNKKMNSLDWFLMSVSEHSLLVSWEDFEMR